MGRLRSTGEWALPLSEVSALARRDLQSGRRELVAVSDEHFDAVSVELDDDHNLGEPVTHPLAQLLADELVSASEGSEFEGLACDGDGRLFVLQEGPARVLVFSPAWDRLEGVINLRVEPHEPHLGRSWHDEELSNARGEALLLLQNAHLLVVKQREPVCFIEFGPASTGAGGLSPDTYLAHSHAWELGGGHTVDYVVLGSWPLHPDSLDRFPGLNEVGLGDDERLYVISSASRRIGRVERTVRPGENTVTITDDWQLPKRLPAGEDGKPEGLTLLPGLIPLISIDTRAAGANLVSLEPLAG
jgi:hypothetical protein